VKAWLSLTVASALFKGQRCTSLLQAIRAVIVK
jgi:hypothetical protein